MYHTFVALCPSGVEALVEEELSTFGVRASNRESGAVVFEASLACAYRACLWSRYANRVLLVIARFNARSAEELYEGVRSVAWQEHMDVDSTFAVQCTGLDAAVRHTRFAALRVKDAVADYFRDRCGRRPAVKRERPDVMVHLFLNREEATLSVDLSGESLHMRGYRSAGGSAPLKETLAAALIRLSGWPGQATKESIFLDPMCGTGTLLIEAALMWGGIAPGLGRRYFGFLKWRGHDGRLWEELVREASRQAHAARSMPWPTFIGWDASNEAVRSATLNCACAGLSGIIRIQRQDLSAFYIPDGAGKASGGILNYLVTNPPYGERLDGQGAEKYLYRCLGRSIQKHCTGWRAAVFTNSVELADALGMTPIEKHRLFNGPIPCHLYVYNVPEPKPELPVPVISPKPAGGTGPADFANRLQKNLRRVLTWARRTGVSCFRIYDADMPEYNMAIDVYEQWIHVQEYAPPKTVDPEKARTRLISALAVIRETLGVGRDHVFVKVRRPRKRADQYQKMESRGKLYVVREGPCRFLVNLTDYLDTGLFLDHRITRLLIYRSARGKRFLNLFGYTGTATVYAALGGARLTVTVDRSKTYCAWARKNFALNGIGGEQHTVVNADCMKWLAGCRERFDLVFADPPTFSNRKSTGEVFDVQRDHVDLIRAVMDLLADGGVLIFSTNYRAFKLDGAALHGLQITDITKKTIPFDFSRTPRIHQCWEIRKA